MPSALFTGVSPCGNTRPPVSAEDVTVTVFVTLTVHDEGFPLVVVAVITAVPN